MQYSPNKYEVLHRFFGYKSFREAQESLIDAILSGRDTLGVMPTGAGKSICFQVPALMLKGTTIVISPLISLMKDQAEALRENGIPAACINSTMPDWECENVFRAAYNGQIKILYVAPERLGTARFTSLVRELQIPLVAVDEAHCVSQWGQDFRPSYLRIAEFVNILPIRPVVAAFTATATDRVRRDIVEILALQSQFEVTTGFDRPNLYFDVRKPEDKNEELLKILSKPVDGSVIIYCATRKNVASVCGLLRLNGFKASEYHAGLSAEARAKAQEDFIFDRIDIIVATNAFGMGIDKSNVRLVIHYNCPMDIESYYQEAGRAGRDGGAATCIMLYSDGDKRLAEFMIEKSHGDSELPENEIEQLKSLDYKRLSKITDYGNLKTCLRSYILGYFGEKDVRACGWCSNCARGYSVEDVTIESQKVLSCIFRLKQNGSALPFEEVCDILLGECPVQYRSLSTYGIMRGESRNRIEQIGAHLIETGLFEECGERKICVLTPKSDEYMKLRTPIQMKFRKKIKTSEKTEVQPNSELFELLREYRKKQATLLGVPPYVVFNDQTLKEMSVACPQNMNDFMRISGVGTIKAERYGRKFMKVIKEYLDKKK